jgi:hypothetical protein
MMDNAYLVNQMNEGRVIKSTYPTGNREWFAYHTDLGYHTTEVIDGKVQSWMYLPIAPHTDARADMVKELEFWRSKGCTIELTTLSLADVRKMDNE